MMPDSFIDDEGNLNVNFSSQNKAKAYANKRKDQTEYANMDLASGYPAHLIWTTKDKRRIAVPNLADDHLLNILAYIRRNIDLYKRVIIMQISKAIIHNLAVSSLFDIPEYEEEEFRRANEELKSKGHRIYNLSDEQFLVEFVPIYRHLYQEAYNRKIYFEVDSNKLGRNDEPNM